MSVLIETISLSCIILIICVGSDADSSTIRDRIVGAKESRGQHYALRRLDCQVFCKKTGFSGYVGGCQCGFTLFANKRSHQNNNDGNIGFPSSSVSDRNYGNKYSSNIGSTSSMPNGFNRLSNDDQSRFDWTHLAYPYLGRSSYGHI